MTHQPATNRPMHYQHHDHASTDQHTLSTLFKIHNLRTHLCITIRWVAKATKDRHPVLILKAVDDPGRGGH
jgi:hypothetical protein